MLSRCIATEEGREPTLSSTMTYYRNAATVFLLCWAMLWPALAPSPAHARQPVVHGVLFYSPTCPHCHKVMTEDLPPLLEKYGERLQLAAVNVRTEGGQALYQAAVKRFGIGKDRRGVPTLVIGDRVLVGAEEIPRILPGLVAELLAAGGVGWPEIEGLASVLNQSADPAAVAGAPPAEGWAGMRERFDQDPRGNGLAVLVLVVMVLVVLWVLAGIKRSAGTPLGARPRLGIALLAGVGLGVAGYLAFVEVARVSAVCGPVGDCNTVQQSEYARLFGVLPLGILGLIGYLAILGGWALARVGHGKSAALGWAAMFVLALIGTLYSIYLTFLEPFVIGATCIWCLTSAILLTALLWLTKDSGTAALAELVGNNKPTTVDNERQGVALTDEGLG